jgi:hypothetical protein
MGLTTQFFHQFPNQFRKFRMTTMTTTWVNSQVTAATGKRGVETGNDNRSLRHNMVQVTLVSGCVTRNSRRGRTQTQQFRQRMYRLLKKTSQASSFRVA